jgi:hypothetical protein
MVTAELHRRKYKTAAIVDWKSERAKRTELNADPPADCALGASAPPLSKEKTPLNIHGEASLGLQPRAAYWLIRWQL